MYHYSRVAWAALMGACATAASSLIAGHTNAQYPDIGGCEKSCDVVAGGWPFHYLVDYPGLSPTGSVDILGALLGHDHLHLGPLAATFAFWSIASFVSISLASRFSKLNRD